MKLTNAYRVVKTTINANTPAMLWGPPGIGKSSLIHQIADELGYGVLDLRLAQLDPTDLRGVPMPNHESGRAHWYLPEFWPERAEKDTTRIVTVEREVKKGQKTTIETSKTEVPVKAGCSVVGPTIIFLDEIEKASVSVKNAALQLVLDRCIGPYKLPDDCPIICAGNREEDGCFSQPLGSALANRMIHLEIQADVDAWGAWARDNGVIDDIIAFIHFRSELLYKYDEGNAFPSPRSWVMASELIQMVKNPKDKKELMTAAVGRGAASEFTAWNNVYRSVDPEAIFRGEMPNFDGKDQSFRYAVTLAAAFALRKRKGGIKKIEENLAKFLDMITSELRVVFLQQLTMQCMEAMSKHPAFQNGLVKDIMSIAT